MESIQLPEIHWYEGGEERVAGWRSEAVIAPHAEIRIADDRTSADDAYRQLGSGAALLWRGDWVNARHLMQALTKRADRRFGAGTRQGAEDAGRSLCPPSRDTGQAGGPAESPARTARC